MENEIKCKELPLEIWKQILSYLKYDHRQLLVCRHLCTSLKFLTDEILTENVSIWKPTFHSDFNSFLKKLDGTRLSTSEQVSSFTSQMKDSTGNPFPNRTLIFVPRDDLQPNQKLNFYNTFVDIVKNFQKDIFTLIYAFNDGDDDIDFLLQFVNICKLTNLRSLTIYKESWNFLCSGKSAKLLVEMTSMRDFRVSDKISELQIFSKFSHLPLFYIMSTLDPIMKSVKRLSYSFTFRANPPIQNCFQIEENRARHFCPNLEKLKLVCPDWKLLDHYCKPVGEHIPPPLKELCLKFPFRTGLAGDIALPQFEIGRKVPEILNTLDEYPQRETIRVFHLDIDEELLSTDVRLDPPINVNLKYPKLKNLILSFSIIFQWINLTKRLKTKFDNVEKLTVILRPRNIEERTVENLYKKIMILWIYFPNIQLIHVPFYGWKLRRGQTLRFECE